VPEALVDDLWFTCLRGGLEWTADDHGNPLRCTLESYFDLVALGDRFTAFGDLRIRAFANDHVPGKASFGFIVRAGDNEDQMIFGCDVRRRLRELEMDPIPEDFAQGPVFHDCQLFDDGPSGVHIPFEKLKEYPDEVRQRLVLVHYNDSIVDHLPEILAAGFSVAWPGDVITAPGWQECVRRNNDAGPAEGRY
jgi:hypothetical protein